jgi:hypothetical protein
MNAKQVGLWVAKAAVLAVAGVLEWTGHLTANMTVMLASALGALGVANVAHVMAEARAATDATQLAYQAAEAQKGAGLAAELKAAVPAFLAALAKAGATVGLVLLCFCTGAGSSACTSGVNPAVITPSVDFSVCVLAQYAQCEAGAVPWPTCAVAIVHACGGDAVAVASVVDAHRKAEVSEGFVVRPLGDGGGE